MKAIKEYENYFILEDGRVLNSKTNKFLKGSVSEGGYLYYRLSKNNQKKSFYAHRLVAEYYIDTPVFRDEQNEKLIVNHKDGNKLNNTIYNLEWVTHRENSIHAFENGLTSKSRQKREKYVKDLNGEVWIGVKDFPLYEVSNKGRIKNIKTGFLLRPSLTGGYLKVRLSNNGQIHDFQVHHLVFKHFIEDTILDRKQFVIDHIDGNKKNNESSNLEKVSLSENVNRSLYITKTNKTVRKVRQLGLDGETIQDFPSIAEAARQLGLDSSTISKVCRGVNQTHGGFKFVFVD